MNLENFNLSKVRWAQRTLSGFDETVTITRVVITSDCRVIIETKPVEKGKTPWEATDIIIMKQVEGTDDFFASEIDFSAPHAKTPWELFSRESTLSISKRALATAFHKWQLRRGTDGDIIGFILCASDSSGCRKERSDVVFVRIPWELPMGAEHMIARYSADDNSSCDAHKTGSSSQRPEKFEWLQETHKEQPKDTPTVGEVNVSIIDDLKKERDKFKRFYADNILEIEKLNGMIFDRNDTIDSLKGEIQLSNKKNSDLRLHSDRLNKTIDALKGHIAKKPDRFKKLRKILAVLKEQD